MVRNFKLLKMGLLDESWIKYINLRHRTDRKEHMEKELARIGIPAKRFEAIKTSEHPWTPWKTDVMKNRTPGAIGCHYSQVCVMAEAYQMNQHAFVLEDDVVFCSDFKQRINYIEKFLENKQWDIIFLGGTVHISPSYWHTGTNPDLPNTHLKRDAECTEDLRIIRVYGAFSTFAYIVNKDSIFKVMTLLDSIIHTSIGIDWAMIALGDKLINYMFLPGCCKQIDNQSDIGNGWTYFSNFSKLGPYWWADNMNEFDPSTFNFGEAKIN